MNTLQISPIEDNFNKGNFQKVLELIDSIKNDRENKFSITELVELNYFESRSYERLNDLQKAWECYFSSEEELKKQEKTKLAELILMCHKAYFWKMGKAEEVMLDIATNEEFISIISKTYKGLQENNNNYKFEKWLGLYYLLVSVFYIITGDLLKAKENNKQSLYYYKMCNYKLYIGKNIQNAAVLFQYEGELELALDKYFEAYQIAEEINDPYTIVVNLYNIGEIYNELNQIPQAIKYYKECNWKAQELQNPVFQASSYLNLLTTYYEEKNESEVQKLLSELNKLVDESKKNPKIQYIAKLAKAYSLLLTGNFANTVKAQDILKKLNYNDEILDFTWKININFLLIEISLLEYQMFANSNVLTDVKTYLKNLFSYANENNNPLLQTETFIVEAKIEILSKNFEKADILLNKAREIVQDKHFHLHEKKIDLEYEKLSKEINKWKVILNSNTEHAKHLELNELMTYINDLKRMHYRKI